MSASKFALTNRIGENKNNMRGKCTINSCVNKAVTLTNKRKAATPGEGNQVATSGLRRVGYSSSPSQILFSLVVPASRSLEENLTKQILTSLKKNKNKMRTFLTYHFGERTERRGTLITLISLVICLVYTLVLE